MLHNKVEVNWILAGQVFSIVSLFNSSHLLPKPTTYLPIYQMYVYVQSLGMIRSWFWVRRYWLEHGNKVSNLASFLFIYIWDLSLHWILEGFGWISFHFYVEIQLCLIFSLTYLIQHVETLLLIGMNGFCISYFLSRTLTI